MTTNSRESTEPLRSSKNGDFLSDMDVLKKISAHFTGVRAGGHYFQGAGAGPPHEEVGVARVSGREPEQTTMKKSTKDLISYLTPKQA
ncbi:MAG: hypothetical protein VB137_07300 [Burkholderia sp.]